jgi:stress-induced morphogen
VIHILTMILLCHHTDGAKLEIYVISARFNGVKLLERHRMVNDIVKDAGLFDHAIHALTVKAWTPEDYEAKKSTIPEDAQSLSDS